MKKGEARALIKKYLEGNCTPEERDLLETWYAGYEQDSGNEPSKEEINLRMERVRRALPVRRKKRVRRIMIYSGLAAALALPILIYFYPKDQQPLYTEVTTASPIIPGGNKARLTLGDGSVISLEDATTGELALESGIRLTKTAAGQLSYLSGKSTDQHAMRQPKVLWNKIEIPKGGQFQLLLPDGSKVWLNASSSLRYPVSFEGLPRRRVELRGEAYFEVAKDATKPFIVQTERQRTEVLGTSFNIYSYPDEPVVKTTLLEGALRVKPAAQASGEASAKSLQPALLKPGEQSTLLLSGMTVAAVDAEAAIDWKNGLFIFNDDNLEQIMRSVARWYNVDISFAAESLKQERFNGSVSRYADVVQLLEKLELTGGVAFDIQGRTIIVDKPKNI